MFCHVNLTRVNVAHVTTYKTNVVKMNDNIIKRKFRCFEKSILTIFFFVNRFLFIPIQIDSKDRFTFMNPPVASPGHDFPTFWRGDEGPGPDVVEPSVRGCRAASDARVCPRTGPLPAFNAKAASVQRKYRCYAPDPAERVHVTS